MDERIEGGSEGRGGGEEAGRDGWMTERKKG